MLMMTMGMEEVMRKMRNLGGRLGNGQSGDGSPGRKVRRAVVLDSEPTVSRKAYMSSCVDTDSVTFSTARKHAKRRWCT